MSEKPTDVDRLKALLKDGSVLRAVRNQGGDCNSVDIECRGSLANPRFVIGIWSGCRLVDFHGAYDAETTIDWIKKHRGPTIQDDIAVLDRSTVYDDPAWQRLRARLLATKEPTP
jgi:hypothetical protein